MLLNEQRWVYEAIFVIKCSNVRIAVIGAIVGDLVGDTSNVRNFRIAGNAPIVALHLRSSSSLDDVL